MPELQQRLESLGRELAYPDTPDLVRVVAERLQSPGAIPRRRHLLRVQRRALALALVLLLLLAGAVVAAVPDARNAFLELLGLRGATVERRSEAPPAPTPRSLDLGEPLSLDRARGRVDFRPLVPSGLPAVRAYVRRDVPGGELSLAWIEGAPHLFFYRDPQGLPRDHSLRLAANVLLVERGRLLVRLEGGFDREKAVELARSLR